MFVLHVLGTELPMAKDNPLTRFHEHGPQHTNARQQYLESRGPAARRRRAAERSGVVVEPEVAEEDVIQANGLPLWENIMLGIPEHEYAFAGV